MESTPDFQASKSGAESSIEGMDHRVSFGVTAMLLGNKHEVHCVEYNCLSPDKHFTLFSLV